MQTQRLWQWRGLHLMHGVLFLSILLVASCQTTTPISATDPETACIWDRPILASRRDTIETINAVKQHNAAWRAICDPRGEKILEKPIPLKTG
ncbi:MAG: hypothetical protein ABGX63_05770 [bacterium]|jgi:hypothetical protein